MKILHFNFEYYYYPEGISCLDDFVAYANEHYHTFIKLIRLEDENCKFPYFIREGTEPAYVNIAAITRLSEVEATVLGREEYDKRLAQVVKEKCVNCVHYEENKEGDNLKGHRENLSLDGECWDYEPKK